MRWQSFEVSTRRRVQVIDVTDRVSEVCRASGVADGLAVLVVPHTTAGICLNEGERNLLVDLVAWLEQLVPQDRPYAHNSIDNNADAHLRAILLGHSVTVPLERGTPVLGTWQRMLFVELDGPRTRQLRVGVVGA